MTSGNSVQGLGVTVSLPKGLFYANSNGGTDPQTIKVQFEFKQVPVVWDSGDTYVLDHRVTYGGTEYKSLKNDNLNKNPASQPTWWVADSDWTRHKLYTTTEETITTGRWSAGYYSTGFAVPRKWYEIRGITDWAGGTTYPIDDMVEDVSVFYKSLQDSNIGKTPASEPTWWETMAEPTQGQTYLPPIREWRDDTGGEGGGGYVTIRPWSTWR